MTSLTQGAFGRRLRFWLERGGDWLVQLADYDHRTRVQRIEQENHTLRSAVAIRDRTIDDLTFALDRAHQHVRDSEADLLASVR
jgi:hypothetical protein